MLYAPTIVFVDCAFVCTFLGFGFSNEVETCIDLLFLVTIDALTIKYISMALYTMDHIGIKIIN